MQIHRIAGVKHAGAATLTLLDPLLAEIRKRRLLREKSPGAFYCKSKAFLHFHEDPAGIFADAKLDFVEFTRIRATTAREQRALLEKIDQSLQTLG
jgi:hypothetical protein